MKREEHIKFCEICSNKKFDFKVGVICGLTMKVADFEESCDDFVENINFKKKIMERKSTIDTSKTKRFINHFIDRLISIFLVSFIIELIPEAGNLIVIFSLLFLYYFCTEYFFNKTIAKFLTKTKIVNNKGEKPTIKELIIRNLSRFIPFEVFSFLGSNSKGWHDAFSNTTVIDEK